ncbi:MAG: DUF6106 family protein [Lachnoclostridium sp.]|nr:DUF6106 family protein [Lachnospira sp.]MCM1248957.1 DUF6106 family protein [Lachnoclostridium sp.]
MRGNMSEVYVECLVKAKPSAAGRFLKMFLVVLTVLLIAALPFLGTAALLIAVVTGVGAYFVGVNTDLEYEYLYLDKELSVDKVLGKSRRKKVAVYSIESMEILAPVNSYHLDSYKNRSVPVKDYSIGEALKPDKRYAMYCDGQKILLSPSEELVKAIKNAAPRKVFSE